VITATLGDRVFDVRASQRLTTSASCLVAGSHGPDRELERLLARQNRGVGHKPILENQHAPSPGRGDVPAPKTLPRIYRFCCWSRRKILDGELPEDPRRVCQTGSINWCLRGVGKETS